MCFYLYDNVQQQDVIIKKVKDRTWIYNQR